MANDESGRLLATAREPGRASDLYADVDAPAFYVDGLGSVGIGAAVSRVAFFKIYDIVPSDTAGLQDMIEKRRVNLNLVMPTTALLDFAAGIVATIVSNREGLTQPNKLVAESLDRALATIREAMPKGH